MEKRRYTFKELREVEALYNKNFDKIMETLDTPECKPYIQEEHRLNELYSLMRKNLLET